MRTPLVGTLVVALGPVFAIASVARADVGPPPTSCDGVVAVDVGKRAAPKAAVAKVAASAGKRRGPPDVRLRGRGLDAAAIAALGREPALAEVAALDVPCLGAAEPGALLAPGVFPGLTRLTMNGCRPDDRVAAALAGLAVRDAIAIAHRRRRGAGARALDEHGGAEERCDRHLLLLRGG
jgi:hypothetical protein